MEDDYELSDFYCPKCLQPLKTTECGECDEFGEIDEYEEDPIYFEPGETRTCDHCFGEKHFFWCGTKDCKVTKDEINKAIKEQNAEYEPK